MPTIVTFLNVYYFHTYLKCSYTYFLFLTSSGSSITCPILSKSSSSSTLKKKRSNDITFGFRGADFVEVYSLCDDDKGKKGNPTWGTLYIYDYRSRKSWIALTWGQDFETFLDRGHEHPDWWVLVNLSLVRITLSKRATPQFKSLLHIRTEPAVCQSFIP